MTKDPLKDSLDKLDALARANTDAIDISSKLLLGRAGDTDKEWIQLVQLTALQQFVIHWIEDGPREFMAFVKDTEKMNRTSGRRRNPSSGRRGTTRPLKIFLDNLEDRNGMVLVTCRDGQRAKVEHQSIDGTRWEADGDFGYAMIEDRPGLVADLKAEGYEVDESEYSPP